MTGNERATADCIAREQNGTCERAQRQFVVVAVAEVVAVVVAVVGVVTLSWVELDDNYDDDYDGVATAICTGSGQ